MAVLASAGLYKPLTAQVEFIEVVTAEDMEAAKKKADDSMLLLFVDVYATWCGPCKMMDSEVYANATVARYMNTHFVNVRMDGETDFGRKYAAERQLQGYPSMFIFSDEGEFLTSIVGFKPVEELLVTVKGVVDNYADIKRYKAAYLQGSLEVEEFSDYITQVRAMGNEELAEKLAGEYMKQQMGETLSDYDIKAVAWYTELSDPWWPQFTLENSRVERVLGEEYIPALEQIYNNSLKVAIDSNDIELISRIANELSPLVEAASDHTRDLRSLPFIQYYYYTNQNEVLMAYVDDRFESDRKGDHRWLFETASQIVDMDQQYQTMVLVEKAESWFESCISLKEAYDYYFYYGMTLFFQQRKEEAIGAFNKANSLATSPDQQQMVQQVLEYVRAR